jgi:hypothetical protein
MQDIEVFCDWVQEKHNLNWLPTSNPEGALMRGSYKERTFLLLTHTKMLQSLVLKPIKEDGDPDQALIREQTFQVSSRASLQELLQTIPLEAEPQGFREHFTQPQQVTPHLEDFFKHSETPEMFFLAICFKETARFAYYQVEEIPLSAIDNLEDFYRQITRTIHRCAFNRNIFTLPK